MRVAQRVEHLGAARSNWRGTMEPKTTMDCHSKLVLHSLRNNQPVQVVMHRPRQTMFVFCLSPSTSSIICYWLEGVVEISEGSDGRGGEYCQLMHGL